MIPLTEGQLTYLNIVLGLILFILATYIIDKWGRKEKYTIREKNRCSTTCYCNDLSNR